VSRQHPMGKDRVHGERLLRSLRGKGKRGQGKRDNGRKQKGGSAGQNGSSGDEARPGLSGCDGRARGFKVEV